MFLNRDATRAAPSRQRRQDRASRRTLLLAVAAALAALGATTQIASAVDYTYCGGAFIAGGGHCDGARHSLTANQAHDDAGSNRVCAGALLNGSFYGSYACGSGFAEHCYGGSNVLTPRIHNGESYTQQMHGRAFYSATCP